MKKILVMSTGGTISQKAEGGQMRVVYSSQELFSHIDTDVRLDFVDVSQAVGAELRLEHLFDIRDLVVERSDCDGYLLISGTDSMEEVAFGLDLLLEPKKPFVITGAAKPTDIPGYDGEANLRAALAVLESPEASELGVLIAMNDNVHPARYVRKHDSGLMGTLFQSHPGPIAQIRSGKPLFYYCGLPLMQRFVKAQREKASNRVMVWTMTVDPILPEALLEGLDGLVLAGMGTGSIATSVVEQLAPKWTSRIPVVITSRCPVGLNYDDYYYKGSLKKYESRGFRILGYEELNPLQARLKLLLEMASTAA
jgi:L-asparaginase